MAPPPNTPANKPSVLKAVYSAPAASSPSDTSQTEPAIHHTIQHELSASLSSHTADETTSKTAYLSELRRAVTSLQNEVNTYLTARMDEDSARATGTGGKDEIGQEENYGEEVANEEDED
ncbi:predicted protein [Uncinocarpus reesii 1704]|uniref:EKC/KEOPS complex subunit GON7 n=1 Tax=Uncinocarpus reesii (strain UAMH 1704) TaxID=336963 RepID=C4JX98_UNCRE|nr:uncharacterized protein UREG_06271 [Uncinocarpus reesii 1704]EEP81406.1 predicted protein [Uncinocarpus reesii 1704]